VHGLPTQGTSRVGVSGEGTPAVGLGVLGPVLLAVDGRPVPVGGAQAETLLALLLLPSAGPQPVDRLVGEMWPGEPPPSARSSGRCWPSSRTRTGSASW
jgi:hypothetical protein